MNNEDRLAEALRVCIANMWRAEPCAEQRTLKNPEAAMVQYRAAMKAGKEVLAAHEASRGSGLEWSKTLCNGKSVDYETADAACKALGEGWRLPTRMELESILDLTRHDPAVDTERFPDTRSECYWTSTPCAWASSCAWVVLFSLGGAYYSLRNGKACVRPVRSVPGQGAARKEKSDE